MGEQQPTFRDHPGEPRLPAAIAVVLAIALYTLLPNRLLLGPRFVVPVLEARLFIPLVVANPTRTTRQNQLLRRLSIGLVLVIAAANATALVLLVHALVAGGRTGGRPLLVAAGQVWATNILVFALAFWELDRGGPVAQAKTARPRLPTADFRFPRTRTTTRSARSRGAPRPSPAGPPDSSTTRTSRSPTPQP